MGTRVEVQERNVHSGVLSAYYERPEMFYDGREGLWTREQRVGKCKFAAIRGECQGGILNIMQEKNIYKSIVSMGINSLKVQMFCASQKAAVSHREQLVIVLHHHNPVPTRLPHRQSRGNWDEGSSPFPHLLQPTSEWLWAAKQRCVLSCCGVSTLDCRVSWQGLNWMN